MKTLTIILAIAFVSAVPVYSQTVNPAKIKFKGIGLDSTYAQVVKALGKPETEEAGKEEGCIGGREKTVKWSSGISLYMMDGDSKDKKTFEVKSFELTAVSIPVSGIRVGDTTSVVRKVFGGKFTTDTDPDTGQTTWLYAMNDRDGPGTTRVVFKDGKVLMIASDFLIC